MKRLNCKITIKAQDGKTYEFTYVKEVVIKRSLEKLTDVARIMIPKHVRLNKKPVLTGSDRIFRRGDKVKIELGYFPELAKRFEGFITKVKPGKLMELECEDEMYLLKKAFIEKKSWKKVTLKKLLQDVCPIPFKAVDANLGDFSVSEVSVSAILEQIKKTYGLRSFIINGELYCGLSYTERANEKLTWFEVGKNTRDSGEDLTYMTQEDFSISAKCISIHPDETGKAKKLEVSVGPKDSDVKYTWHFPTNIDKETLAKLGEEKLTKYSYDGVRGSFKAFGEPLVNHYERVGLIDNLNMEHQGKYFIKSTEEKFGTSGYSQTIELDLRV